ncbi:hypothetical protein GN956_G13431 [Arapaima gigas]
MRAAPPGHPQRAPRRGARLLTAGRRIAEPAEERNAIGGRGKKQKSENIESTGGKYRSVLSEVKVSVLILWYKL